MKTRNFLILLVLAVLVLASIADAQRSSRITRPCPNSTTPAKLEIDRAGNIKIVPCLNGKVAIGDVDAIGNGTALTVNDAMQLTMASQYLSAGLGGESANLYVDTSMREFMFTVNTADGLMNFNNINRFSLQRTVTAAGTTGNQTINKPAGTVNFAAGTSSITVTNSTAAAASLIFCTVQSNDATANACRVTDKAAGSFTIRLNANATAETAVAFWVTN